MFISPKYDDMMKELFHNDTVLRYFLSDILGLRQDGIRNLRMKNTFLRKRRRLEKQGMKTEEDLKVLKAKTKNPGILEAISELRRLSLDSPMKRRYDAYLKRKRDEKAREEYVREEGREEGRTEGESFKLVSQVCRKLRRGKGPEAIAEELEEDLGVVQGICRVAAEFGPEYDERKVFEEFSRLSGV